MPASAIITALMSLENPRSSPGKAATVILDAGIYYPGDSNPAVALLRYYNKEEHIFRSEGGLYFVTAKIVKMRPGVDIHSNTMTDSDYDLQGDIIQLIPLPPGSSAKPRPATVQVIATVADSVNTAEAWFEVQPTQWTTADKTGSLPIKACIAEESKWSQSGRSRALPTPRSLVAFLGYLVNIEWDKKSEMPVRFVVEIERELEFLSRPPKASSATSASFDSAEHKTPGRGSKLRFNMIGDSPSPVALGKRPIREASLGSVSSEDTTLHDSPSPAKRIRIEKED